MQPPVKKELFISEPTSSYAVNRVARMTAKFFSIVLLLSGAETALNAVSQLPHLNAVPALISLAAVLIGQLAIFIDSWFTSEYNWALVTYPIIVAAVLLSWNLQVPAGQPLPDGFQPWIWWALGAASLSAALSMPLIYGATYMVLQPLAWFFIHLQDFGGSASLQRAAQDSIYTFLWSACFAMLLIFLRYEARKVDLANQEVAAAKVRAAHTDAIEQERGRVDALIHDKVLTTLLVAADADTKTKFEHAKTLAEQALFALKSAKTQSEETDDSVTSYSLFGVFFDRYRGADSGFTFSESGASDLTIPKAVVAALTEATLQAAENSLVHAGSNVERSITLRGTTKKIKIVIKDNGRGFRVSRIPKNRLGVRMSIIQRMESVGGRAIIDSAPGRGTAVILEWSAL